MDTRNKQKYPEPDYKKLYFQLFNAITDALALLEREEVASAALRLATAQCLTEEAYLSCGD